MQDYREEERKRSIASIGSGEKKRRGAWKRNILGWSQRGQPFEQRLQGWEKWVPAHRSGGEIWSGGAMRPLDQRISSWHIGTRLFRSGSPWYKGTQAQKERKCWKWTALEGPRASGRGVKPHCEISVVQWFPESLYEVLIKGSGPRRRQGHVNLDQRKPSRQAKVTTIITLEPSPK